MWVKKTRHPTSVDNFEILSDFQNSFTARLSTKFAIKWSLHIPPNTHVSFEHVNTHWWTTFQLLSLWLSMSTGLWPQTTHASSKSPQSSRFHNFYVSQLYRAYVTTCCHVGSVELWNVHYSRYTDTTVCWNLDPSWRRMCILICRLARWPLT